MKKKGGPKTQYLKNKEGLEPTNTSLKKTENTSMNQNWQDFIEVGTTKDLAVNKGFLTAQCFEKVFPFMNIKLLQLL